MDPAAFEKNNQTPAQNKPDGEESVEEFGFTANYRFLYGDEDEY